MKLKESFRMQNHLNGLSQEALIYLSDAKNVMKVKQEHLRSRSNPKAEDESLEVIKDNDYIPDKVVDLYLDLLKEREKLTEAIGKAKANADIDIDAALMLNKSKQDAIVTFKRLGSLKSYEKEENGKDFLINAEGNQTAYFYTIKTVGTIDFDRKAIKGIVKRLQRECDEVSSKVDLLNVTLDVDYTPKYDLDETFDDAYEKYTN